MRCHQKIWLAAISSTFLSYAPGFAGHSGMALAACLPNSQCKVTDGGTVSIADQTVIATGVTGAWGGAIVATNSSTINGKNLMIKAPKLSGHYGVHVDSGSVINLENSHIEAGYGLTAKDAGSLITMRGGSINVSARAI